MTAPYQFKNYLQTEPKIPAWVWTIGKIISVTTGIALTAAMFYRPAEALEILWRIFIPLVPLVFFIAPGIWRNICPMATLNQLPRHLKMSMAKPLPPVIKEYGYVVGIVLLFTLVTSRKIVFNTDASAAALLIGSALLLPFIFGIFFKGRSGWCGSFCPLLPEMAIVRNVSVVPKTAMTSIQQLLIWLINTIRMKTIATIVNSLLPASLVLYWLFI